MMKYCREMFLKCPPSDSVGESQLLNNDSKAIDDNKTQKKSKKEKRRDRLQKKAPLDDSSNWVTDSDQSSDECLSPRRRRMKLRAEDEHNKFMVMKRIYEAQPQEVKNVINDLYNLHLKQRRTALRRRGPVRPMFLKKHKRKNFNINKVAVGAGISTNVAFSNNVKILARLQRRRRHRGKPRSKRNRHKKFPRRRRRANGKKGNRQGRKRCLRAQRLLEKGVLIAGRKLLDKVWKDVRDPMATATSFCNNNTRGLSKIHKKQIELYERIEDDLHRLDRARQERAEAAFQRQAKEEEKEAATHEGFKNKIEARAVARAEQDSLRKQRRAARKQRVLENNAKKQKPKCEDLVTSREKEILIE